ncbi:MAG: DEAD/DEAH box helicase [Desulfobacteraceae bacterium]|nr:DEAD/DEAH box helicase [Desulfobacterales bacterium]MBL6968267.1 DEAD/DEAH box helicase [Desulfobacteraceae bacterium]MBL7173220.1 DEAD/DEAH box helicase [Desulfobacteraceae bacterium]
MPLKKYYHRPKHPRSGKRSRSRGDVDYSRPKIDPGLKPSFQKIGIPEEGFFTPDPFQLEAVDLIRDYDVLVSAPTGSGKTWIASQVIRSYLSENRRVWYASPLKALSNSIYQEFGDEFGRPYCGILTGDRKENPDAPVIVGTTEILRNQLYDAMYKGLSINTDLVILDEAHYLSDPDRGVVWEEVLIYLPPRVKLLLLSATISNPDEVCAWLRKIRGSSNRVVRSEERPVPLETLFLFPDGHIVPLGTSKGLNLRVKRLIGSKGGFVRGRHEKVDFGKVITFLRELDLLPAIFFLKSRADCDHALLTCPGVDKPEHIKRRLKGTLSAFLKDYPHLEGHRQIRPLLESMVGSHHGGQLPYWKVLIERIMNKGLLDAIFSTSTVAAGVNFPARTVALLQSDRYNGHEFADLTATDLHQMIGRAGRRGKDNIGFVLVIPGYYQNPQLIYELQDSPPDPLQSQIHINFSMTLNLLLSHTPFEVKDLLAHSFAAFQAEQFGDSKKKRWGQMLSELSELLPKAKCDNGDPFGILENIRMRSELQKTLKRSKKTSPHDQWVKAHQGYLKPGRVFLHKNGNVYVVFKTYMDGERLISASHNIRRANRQGKRQLKLRRVDLNQIQALYDHVVDLPEDYQREKLDLLLNAIPMEALEVLSVEIPGEGSGTDVSEKIREKPALLPCEECEHFKACHRTKNGRVNKLLGELVALSNRTDGSGGGLWLDFKRHVRFLKETGFVDEADRLTSDGQWASNLRLDQPLLIAEAIRQGAFEGISPVALAGGLAPFVWDRGQEMVLKVEGALDMTGIEEVFYRLIHHIEGIRAIKEKRGFQSPPIMFWPAAALFMWAKGVPWEKLLYFVSADEGDMASLIMRTADHLRQVVALKETHPRLASVAAESIGLILREPVYIL